MGKRFIEAERWEKPFFMKLAPVEKLLLELIWSKCDNSGMIEVNFPLWSMLIGAEVGESQLQPLISAGQLIKVDEVKYFCPDFCSFQSSTFSSKKGANKQVAKLLEKHGLINQARGTFADQLREEVRQKGVPSLWDKGGTPMGPGSYPGSLQEKEKEREKEREKEKPGDQDEIPVRSLDLEESKLMPLRLAQNQMKAAEIWKERVCMNLSSRGFPVTRHTVNGLIDEFILHAKGQFDGERSDLIQYQKWFQNWAAAKFRDGAGNMKQSASEVPAYLKKKNKKA